MINASKRSLLLCIALLMPFIYLLANSTDYHPPLKPTNSPFTFTETEITAHPGETVQICVDKIGGGLVVFGTTSIVVDAVGNTSPHLSDFAAVTLIFPSGVTQACFDLVIRNSISTEDYQLRIQGLEEYLKIKVELEEANHSFCGAFLYQPSANIGSSNSTDETIVLDRFGNIVVEPDLTYGGNTCPDAGHFNLIFSNGFSTEEMNTICEVFIYLSSLFESNQVNIPIQINKTTIQGNNVLAAGSSYYPQRSLCGTEPGYVWSTINTNFNYRDFIAAGSIGRIDISSSALFHTMAENPTGSFDLYSVVLHEALHVLGLTSRLGENGVPLNNSFYSDWDTKLILENNITNILIAGNEPDCCYKPIYNPALLSTPPQDMTLGCNPSSRVYFGNNLATVNGDYAPWTFNTINELIVNRFSHFDAACDLENYVIHASFLTGDDSRRVLTETELAALCELEYTLTSIEGTEPTCNNNCLTALNDDIVSINNDYETIVFDASFIEYITGNDLIGDDIFSIEFSCAYHSISNASPIPIPILQNGDGDFYIQGIGTTYNSPVIVVCYQVEVCGECYDAQIFINLSTSFPELAPCAFPCFPQDNLFCYGDFEDFAIGSQTYYSQLPITSCDVFDTWTNNTPDISGETGFPWTSNFLRFYFSETESDEHVIIPLSAAIAPGCEMNISFLTRTAGTSFLNPFSGLMNVFGTENDPCQSSGIGDCDNPTTLGDFVCIENDIICPDGSQATAVSFTWTNNEIFPINFLVFDAYSNNGNAYIEMDDLVITSNCITPPEPSGDISATVLDECGTVLFEITNLSDEDATVEWNVDGQQSNGSNFTYQFQESGIYPFSVTITEPLVTAPYIP